MFGMLCSTKLIFLTQWFFICTLINMLLMVKDQVMISTSVQYVFVWKGFSVLALSCQKKYLYLVLVSMIILKRLWPLVWVIAKSTNLNLTCPVKLKLDDSFRNASLLRYKLLVPPTTSRQTQARVPLPSMDSTTNSALSGDRRPRCCAEGDQHCFTAQPAHLLG